MSEKHELSKQYCSITRGTTHFTTPTSGWESTPACRGRWVADKISSRTGKIWNFTSQVMQTSKSKYNAEAAHLLICTTSFSQAKHVNFASTKCLTCVHYAHTRPYWDLDIAQHNWQHPQLSTIPMCNLKISLDMGMTLLIALSSSLPGGSGSKWVHGCPQLQCLLPQNFSWHENDGGFEATTLPTALSPSLPGSR